MKFKKDFFHQKRWSWEKKRSQQILSQNNSVKTQGMKNEILHFETFSVRDETFSKYISIKFFFWKRNIFSISLQSLEKVSKCKISFFIS